MSDARDAELLKYIRSYGQSEASPPPCEFEHCGLTVVLSPELAKQFEPPADPLAFAKFMEEMLPHCRRFISGYPGTRAEDHEKVLQGIHRSLLDAVQGQSHPELSSLWPQRATTTVCRVGLSVLLQFLEGTLPGVKQGPGSAAAPTLHSDKPFRPAHSTIFIAADRSQYRLSPTRLAARRPEKSKEGTAPAHT